MMGTAGFPHLRTELFDLTVAGYPQNGELPEELGIHAQRAAVRKEAKYGPAVWRAGHRFTPVAAGLYGWLDKRARQLLHNLAHMRI